MRSAAEFATFSAPARDARAVVLCATLALAEVDVAVALTLAGPEPAELVGESVGELNVVFRDMAVPVPTAVPDEVILMVFATFPVRVVGTATLEEPVPPTKEKRPV